ATNGIDYQSINTQFTLPANQTSGTLTINVFKDNLVEPAETVILTLQPDPSYSIATAAATVTIADSPAVVSIAATTPNASEAGPVNGVFTFTRSGGNTAAPLTLTRPTAGTATNGIDYQTINTQFTLPANQTSGTLTINV